jgi:hypothetical protein
MPLSIFHEKTDEKIIVNQVQTQLNSLTQAKQMRKGYITKDKELCYIEYTYAQKSAYDKQNRRSLEGSMFGYSAIKSGTSWQFSVKYDTISENDLQRIKENLLGKKRLGKSKSAQYGEVEISLAGENEKIEDTTLQDETILYANSRIALMDAEGNPTYDLTNICSGLSKKNINYAKTQIRTSTFTPYNGVRQTKDYERVVINKGSVIVLTGIDQQQLDEIKAGVGAYLSEGFGDILINPTFLTDTAFRLKEISKEEVETVPANVTNNTAKFLQMKYNAKKEKLDLAEEVHDFIEKNKSLYSQKMNSQWGSIRSLCANTKDIYADVKEYITHGIAKEKWDGAKGSTLLNAIKKSSKSVEFTKLLAMQMPKVKTNDEETQNAN